MRRLQPPSTYWPAMQRQYQNLRTQYMGRVGQQIERGETPQVRWMDFLGQYNPGQYYRNLSGWERGENPSMPMFRFMRY